MIPKVIIVTTIVISGGCASARQPHLNQYQWASYGRGDTAAGDVGHASMPGARVVIPKTQPRQPSYMLAFDKPSTSCLEIDHQVGSDIRKFACAPPQVTVLNVKAQTVSNQTPAVPCDESLWAHIYHQKRLQVKAACITVHGTLADASHGRDKDGCRHEADGDCHTWLKLDAVEGGLLNNANRQNEGGNLVLEPICHYRVTQADAVQACKNWKQDLKLPPPGTRVRVTGAYVLDTQHGHFEIHPITSIEPFAATSNSCSDDGRLWWPARADGQCYAADKPN